MKGKVDDYSIGDGLTRMNDCYKDFRLLQAAEREGVDYRIHTRRGRSGIAVMALHGGDIEPGTSEVAAALATPLHSLYLFEGLKSRRNRQLHLASTRFDEPRALQLAQDSDLVVTIHGCSEKDALVLLGGLHTPVVCRIRDTLSSAGFRVDTRSGLQGLHPQNLCNIGRSGGGAQLELSSGLRRAMFLNLTRSGRKLTTAIFNRFVAVLTATLSC
jgi:phage replication-related protein YjqB (UPF0714/DUF867 family)